MSRCILCRSESAPPLIRSAVTGKCVCEECMIRFLYWLECNADIARKALGIEDKTVVHSGMRCSICGEKQIMTQTGATCPNGHAGVPSVDPGRRLTEI